MLTTNPIMTANQATPMTDLPPYRLYPPGTRKRNKSYVVRFTLDGERSEASTGATTEEGALDFFRRLVHGLRTHPLPSDPPSEEYRRQTPQAMALGEFEHWLLANYRLDGERVVGPDGREVRFWRVQGGYLACRIRYRHWIKSVLEHRLKFFLAHRWLPSSIDHINGIRNDNTLGNLRASTPAMQSLNTGRSGKFAGEDL